MADVGGGANPVVVGDVPNFPVFEMSVGGLLYRSGGRRGVVVGGGRKLKARETSPIFLVLVVAMACSCRWKPYRRSCGRGGGSWAAEEWSISVVARGLVAFF